MLLAARAEAARATEAALRTHRADVERVQDEYEAGKRAITERLTEACEERGRKLREEKDSLELNLGALELLHTYMPLARVAYSLPSLGR